MWTKKGFVNIILVVLVVILAGAAGYFAFVKKQTSPTKTKQQKLNTQPTTQQMIPAPTSSILSSSETAGWDTYANERYNFSISYPQNWQKTEEKFTPFLRFGLFPRDPATEQKMPSNMVLFFIYENLGDYLNQGRHYANNEVYVSLKSNLESGSKLGRLKYKPILFNGFQSYLVDAGRDGSSIQLEQDGRVYLVILPYGISDTSQFNDVQKQILNSFKFLR